MKELLLFPTPIYVDKLDVPQQTVDYLNSLPMRNVVKDYVSSYGSYSDNTYVLNDPECAVIKNYVERAAAQILTERFSFHIEDGVQITQSWITIKKPGEKHARHYHPNSILSGVYYYDDNDNYSSIVFEKGGLGHSNNYTMTVEFNHEHAKSNPVSWDNFVLQPTKKDIIFFPSYMSHYVNVNTSNDDRRCLAFNIIPKYGFGNKRGLDFLPL